MSNRNRIRIPDPATLSTKIRQHARLARPDAAFSPRAVAPLVRRSFLAMDVYTLALVLAALIAIPVLGNAIHILIAIVRYGF